MIVVADTSPINYLVQIGLINVLQQLYGNVLLPDEVLAELQDQGAPQVVSSWALRFPDWIQIRKPTLEPPTELAELDPGEARRSILPLNCMPISFWPTNEKHEESLATHLD